ncbi:protein FAM200B-like [Schistocerca gregaria]|uniref:protein FAM200B-like n=1 Tax=Schistocerca gregaria TaxID=7010 RepID=UPI00211E9816|nr:protein FAM200B-like [Schistocerca gregaria]
MAVRSEFFCKYELSWQRLIGVFGDGAFVSACSSVTIHADDLGTEHKRLLFHTEVRWLSKENVLVKLFELEVIRFLEIQNKTELCMELRKPSCVDHSVRLLCGDSNIIYHWDAITAYTDKLLLWECKIVTCFPILFGILGEAGLEEDGY